MSILEQHFGELRLFSNTYFYHTTITEVQQTIDKFTAYISLMGYETKLTKEKKKITFVIKNEGKTYSVVFNMDDVLSRLLTSISFNIPGHSSFYNRKEEDIIRWFEILINEL